MIAGENMYAVSTVGQARVSPEVGVAGTVKIRAAIPR